MAQKTEPGTVDQSVRDFAAEVIRTEAAALMGLLERLSEGIDEAVSLVLECKGSVIVTGVGKAGIVGQKISATLASTGTPSHSLHPTEAVHGDLGRVLENDVVLVLSNSGASDEILRLLPHLKKIGARIISMTGDAKSPLAVHSDVVLDLGPVAEACPLGLAPSASTTAMLAMGDALALSVMRSRGFTTEQYAIFHPGGTLGRNLLRVEEVMRTGPRNPAVGPDATVREAVIAITNVPESMDRAGAVEIVSGDGKLLGLFTDGDLRRLVETEPPHFLDDPISRHMTARPLTIRRGHLASEALYRMKTRKFDTLPVVDESGLALGIIDVQDLLAIFARSVALELETGGSAAGGSS
jgi:arabinose-5-phosphate isomerase